MLPMAETSSILSESTSPATSTFLVARINALKFIIVDNILGLHLPFIQVLILFLL